MRIRNEIDCSIRMLLQQNQTDGGFLFSHYMYEYMLRQPTIPQTAERNMMTSKLHNTTADHGSKKFRRNKIRPTLTSVTPFQIHLQEDKNKTER